MKRICCLVFARLASSRVPNKLLEEVGGQTLLSRGMSYLTHIKLTLPMITPIVCSPDTDQPIIDACRSHGIEWLKDSSITSSWCSLVKPHVSLLRKRFDWVWDANIFCHPFLRLEAACRIVSEINRRDWPFVVVTEKRGIVWNEHDWPAIGSAELANTTKNPIYREPAHVAYCWPVDRLTWTDRDLAGIAVPVVFKFHWSELIDIDTPEDLEHARAVAGSLPGER